MFDCCGCAVRLICREDVLQLIQIDPVTIRQRSAVVLESGTYATDCCALHVEQMFSSSPLRTKTALIPPDPCVRVFVCSLK